MSPHWIITAALCNFAFVLAADNDNNEVEIKFSECPPAVRKTMQAESHGATIATVSREKDEDNDELIYWAEITLGSRSYSLGVLQDGTLAELNLAVDDEDDVPLDRCPAAVQAAFRAEAFGEKIESVGKDIRYGVTIYETVFEHKEKSYNLVIAEDGILVEKVLVIDDEELELAMCPAAVQAALRTQARGGAISEVTRSTGIARPTYEAEVEIKGKVYLVEVDQNGVLLGKSLDAGE